MLKILKSTDEVFRYEIGGVKYEIPRFTEAISGFGVDRRAMSLGLDKKDFGNRVLIAFQIALRDDEDSIRAFEYLNAQQQLDLLKAWTAHSGGEPGES